MSVQPLNNWRAFVFTIHRNKEKLQLTMSHLEECGIKAEPFYGLDASVTGIDRTKWEYPLDRGPGCDYHIGGQLINIQLSYLMLWRVMSYLDGDSFLILEDDVRFDPGWSEELAKALPSLPADWDLFFLGNCCCQNRPENVPIYWRLTKIKYALCLHAFAVRKKAIAVLMRDCERIYAPADIAIAVDCMPKLNCYAMLPRIAHQHNEEIPP